jgi:hypothetical protein
MLSVSDHENYAYLVENNNGGSSVSQRTLTIHIFHVGLAPFLYDTSEQIRTVSIFAFPIDCLKSVYR